MTYAPGTIVAFSGHWLTPRFPWFSATAIGIQVRTMSRWSHVAIIVDIRATDIDAARTIPHGINGERWVRLLDNPPGICLLESTMLATAPCLITQRHIKGVQCHLPHGRIHNYPGRVATLEPRTPLTEDQRGRLARYALSIIGRPYDARGAALMGTFCWKYLRGRRAADRETYVCSELAIEANIKLRWTGVGTPPKPGYADPGVVVDYTERWTHGELEWET